MKRICFVNSTEFWGGGEELHLAYAIKLRERQYDVCLAVKQHSPLDVRARRAGFRTFHVSHSNLSVLNPLAYTRLIGFFKSAGIDTVIISSSHDLKPGAIAARIAGVKRIVYYRGLAVPIANRWLNRYLLRTVLTHVVANSKATRAMMLRDLRGTLTERDVHVVYHGVAIHAAERDVPTTRRSGGDVVTIGNAGRLTHQKGQQHLIDIAKRLKASGHQFRIVIAGTGELHDALAAAIEANDVRNEVELLGFVDDMPGFMESIDIFALTSEWEGFGFVLAEAMIARKPLVAFDISSNPELIENGRNGLLVEFADVDDFARKLGTLIEDESLRARMGVQGRRVVEERFSLDRLIDEFAHCISNDP